MTRLGVRRNHIESEPENENQNTPWGNESNLRILACSLLKWTRFQNFWNVRGETVYTTEVGRIGE